MLGRLALAGCLFALWSVCGFLLGWGWLYCCARNHGGVFLVLAGTLQGALGGLLLGAWILAGKLKKPPSLRSAVAFGVLTAVPFTAFGSSVMSSGLFPLLQNRPFPLEDIGFLSSPLVNGIAVALLSAVLIRLVSPYIGGSEI